MTGEATDEERAQLQARFTALAATGVPNRFGAQRFGAGGDNAAVGLALLRGERRERDKRRRRLLLSALQSAVFNRALELRAASGALGQVRAGDVLQKIESGGLFVTTDPALDQSRVDRGELCPTGPLPGGREIEPPPGTPARAIDDEAIASVGATREEFAGAGRELPGARRAVLLKPSDATIEIRAAPDGPIRVLFSLPSGAYATVFIDAILPTSCAGDCDSVFLTATRGERMHLTQRILGFTLLGSEWVLWLLIALSVLSITVMVERAIVFGAAGGNIEALGREVVGRLLAADPAGARRLLEGRRAPAATVAAAGIAELDRGADAVSETMAGAKARLRVDLERHLGILGTLGNNAPFIGLLRDGPRHHQGVRRSGAQPGRGRRAW